MPNLIRKGRRVVQQNEARAILIEVDNRASIDKSALDLLNRVLCYTNDFPVIMIGS